MDRWVIQQNILRFRDMLLRETESARRREIERLLAQEKESLQELDRTEREI